MIDMGSEEENKLFAKLDAIEAEQRRIVNLLLVGDPENNKPGILERIRRLEWFKAVVIAAGGAGGGTLLTLVIHALWGIVTGG